MRYSGSRLACGSCHLGTGTEPGTLTLLQATQHYPRFSARTGSTTDIEDRINECMQRSMNGSALPRNSPEMIAMAAYIRSLGAPQRRHGREPAQGEGAAGVQDSEPRGRSQGRQAGLRRPLRASVTARTAWVCWPTANPLHGYVFPPLWGPDSFNDGAGMHRVLTAARFIKARMPLGKADLTDDQAFDVAAYINSQPRPHMANLDRDFPDRSTKPVDNGYGPYADSFSLEQHQFGPFQPIEAYYKSLKKSK